MKLLDQTIQPDGTYLIRIWLDELGPDAIREYTRTAYRAPLTYDTGEKDNDGNSIYAPIEWSMTKSQYEAEQVAQAQALATQEIAAMHPEPTVVTQDADAIAEQQAALEAQAGDDSE